MNKPIDFQKLVAEVTDSRNFLGETAATMTGETKKNFEVLLKAIDHHFEMVKTEVPKCQQMFIDKFEELKKRHEKNVVDLKAARENYEKIQKQIAEGDLPKPKPVEDEPVDITRGIHLRNELLNKFLPENKTKPPQIGVAWEDWNLQDGWTSDSDPQPNS